MSEPSRPPVAVRVARPYESDDDLLAHELETIGKTSVILIGAQPRPTGVILRFEMTLASGAVALRGEGRVLGHKEQAFRGQPGLALRFTRLDPKSKALVDRATAMREARATPAGPPSDVMSQPSLEAAPPASARAPSVPPLSVAPPSGQDAAIAEALSAASPEPPPAASVAPSPMEASPAEAERISVVPVTIDMLQSGPPSTPAQPAPPERASILARLRERGAALPPERVAEILTPRRPR